MGVFEAVVAALNSFVDRIWVPVDQRTAIIFEGGRDIRFGASSGKNAYDPFSKLVSLRYFPVYPRTRVRLLTDEDDHS